MPFEYVSPVSISKTEVTLLRFHSGYTRPDYHPVYVLYVNGTPAVRFVNKRDYLSVDYAGVCLGEWIRVAFSEDIKRLDSHKFFGLSFYDEEQKRSNKCYCPGNVVQVDGACGFDAMNRILRAIGFRAEYKGHKGNDSFYDLIPEEPDEMEPDYDTGLNIVEGIKSCIVVVAVVCLVMLVVYFMLSLF